MENLNLKINNFNNKLASNCFLHIWKTLGSLDGNDLIKKTVLTLNDSPDKWRVHDIGVSDINDLPTWMIKMSHDMDKAMLKDLFKMKVGQVYWVIIKKEVGVRD